MNKTFEAVSIPAVRKYCALAPAISSTADMSVAPNGISLPVATLSGLSLLGLCFFVSLRLSPLGGLLRLLSTGQTMLHSVANGSVSSHGKYDSTIGQQQFKIPQPFEHYPGSRRYSGNVSFYPLPEMIQQLRALAVIGNAQ
eukprot:scaffold658551_cov39-Prasinocladus_malaysianus.AAC.1